MFWNFCICSLLLFSMNLFAQTVELGPTDDCYVSRIYLNSDNPDVQTAKQREHCVNEYRITIQGAGAGQEKYGLVQFDISKLTQPVEKATLFMDLTGGVDVKLPATFALYGSHDARDWDETEVTLTTAPNNLEPYRPAGPRDGYFELIIESYTVQNSNQQIHEFDVTHYIAVEYAIKHTMPTFIFSPISGCVRFATKENKSSDKPPKLVIVTSSNAEIPVYASGTRTISRQKTKIDIAVGKNSRTVLLSREPDMPGSFFLHTLKGALALSLHIRKGQKEIVLPEKLNKNAYIAAMNTDQDIVRSKILLP